MTNSKRRATREKGSERWIYALLLLCILASFIVRGVVAVEDNTNSSAFDQRSYLGLGLNISEGRDLSDGKRNPLLPALLAPFAERDWPYYTKAKFLNLGLGVIGLLLVFELGRRWFNAATGALAAGLLSLNPPFLHVSSHVMAEPLLMIMTLSSWYLMWRTLEKSQQARPWCAIAAGGAAGLAYMTKATALQMVPAFGLAAILTYWGGKWWKRRELWFFGLAWLITCMPLLVFNTQEFQNPLYNYNYKHEIFLDSPTQRHFADISEAPTLQTYLANHSWAEMAHRLWYGLREVTRILFRALAPVASETFRGWSEAIWIVVWIGLLAFLFLQREDLAPELDFASPLFILPGFMLILSLIPLGWFVQASNVGPRFIVLFHPIIYILVIGTLHTLYSRLQTKEAVPPVWQSVKRWGVRGMLAGLTLWAVIGAVRAFPHIRRYPVEIDREANARGQAVLEWLENGTPYGTRVLWGPSYTLPNWIYERRLSLKDVPSKAESWQDITAFAKEEELDYAIVDWTMVQRRQEAFSPYFGFDYPYVIIKELPPTWALTLPYDGFPSNWAVFRISESNPLEHQLSVILGNIIELVGYEIHPPSIQPGQSTYVTLYWRALENVEKDYSVFVHMMDEDRNLVAQSDSFPLEGRYPTSQWRQGNLLGDRHTLVVPTDASVESYHLAVGMYLLETMERLDAVK
ncbi:MAG: glycosyltransferase family 39 protein, partial [Chloroflexota bacterium]|nr:glycosyltransferase family 39 protein [Chloroflexota bacterium]